MITITMPVYNEAQQIYDNVCRVRAILKEANIEANFLLVDDGSKDESWKEICRLAEDFGDTQGLSLSRNFGKEAAICAALENVDSDACVILDSDLQHPPELIVEMERLWREQGYEVVEGIKEDRGKESFAMKAAANIFYKGFRKSTGIDIGIASDFKLLDRKVIDAWKQLPERETFFRGMSSWIGFKRVQIPFTVQERLVGSSKWSFSSLAKLAINSVISYSSAPLYLVTIIGAVLLVFEVVMLVDTLVVKILGHSQSGFTTVILMQLLIGSCIMLSLGIIGVYLSKIYNESKGRPRFIISKRREVKNSDESNK